MTLPFIHAADLEEHAESYLFSQGYDAAFGTQDQVRSYLLAHGINPDHQPIVIGGLCSTERAICREQGHDWVEEGDAGPDSGWIGATCSRCGESHHTTLY